MKTIVYPLWVLLLFCIHANGFAQVGIGTTTPNSNSILDLQSTSKGLIVLRVDFAQLPADPSGANGMLVYVIDNGPSGNNAFYYYKANKWCKLDLPDSIGFGAITGLPNSITGYGITDAMSTAGYVASSDNFVGTVNPMPLVMKSNSSEAMRINPNGKVGIGNSNPDPSARVTITASGSENPMRLENLQVSNPPQPDFLVVDANGNVSRRPNALGGISNMITYAVSISVPQINNNSSYQLTIPVPGATVGAGVTIGPEADLSSGGGTVVIQAWVQSPGNVSIKWSNVKNEKANPPTTVYHFLLFQ